MSQWGGGKAHTPKSTTCSNFDPKLSSAEPTNYEAVPTKIHQIELMPRALGLTPRWGTWLFPKGHGKGMVRQLASGREREPQALDLNADADILGGSLEAGDSLRYEPDAGRYQYIVVVSGSVHVNGLKMHPGDGWVGNL